MTQLLPPKKEVALALLERSNVDIYLDPRAKGVVVPPQFRKEPRLILKIGLNMPVPIPDLRLDDESMSCTLSFNRTPFYCVVPWSSVFAMVGDDGRGMVWPDDVPQELSVRVAEEQQPRGPVAVPPPPASGAPSSRGKRGARAAEGQPDSERSGGGKKKGGKKKKEEAARPVLVAVPPPPPSEAAPVSAKPKSEPKPEPAPAASPEPAAAREEAAAVPPASAPPPAREAGRPGASVRPKRELPPYLRVVK